MNSIQKIRIVNTLQNMTEKLYNNNFKEYKLSKRDIELIIEFLTEHRFNFVLENTTKSNLPFNFENDQISLCPNLIN